MLSFVPHSPRTWKETGMLADRGAHAHMQPRPGRERSVPSHCFSMPQHLASACALYNRPPSLPTKRTNGRQNTFYICQCSTSNQHAIPGDWTYSSSPQWLWLGSPPHSRLETSPPGRGRCPPRNPPLRCSELDQREGERKLGKQ